jgi:hypothetical protein
MYVEIDANPLAVDRNGAARVIVRLCGQRFTCEFRHHSIAVAVCKALAREHKLRKMPGILRHEWRSKS